MIKKQRFVSLHVKLGLIMLAGLVAALGTYFLANAAGRWAVDTWYMSEETIHRRNMAIVSDFQRYIDENHLSSRDTDEIAWWTISQEDVYILLYKNQHLAFEAGWWGIDDEEEPIGREELADTPTQSLYPVSFRDGVFQAVVFDFSETRLYDLVTFASIALACVLFALFILLYNRRVTRSLISVSQEIQQIGRGHLNFRLESRGNDELARLVTSVEAMRRSLLEKTREEQEALKKNSELITAMSHDLRNPLTALMGYLDLAKSGQYASQDELRQYISAGYDKAVQLRELSDQLLRYALVFGGQELAVELEEYDAKILLDQLFGEQMAVLQQYGFSFQTMPLQHSCRVRVDVSYLKRVLDNLLDNVRKYADPQKPVALAAMVEEGWLHICVANTVRPEPAAVESNKIGLKICSHVMQQLGGSFTTAREADHFTAEVLLPVVEETP